MTLLVLAAALIALRIWVSDRIDSALAQPMLCLTPHIRTELAAGRMPARQRDLIVVRNAQFGDGKSTGGPAWHPRGMLIELGYHLLWTERGRAAVFARMAPHVRDCTAPTA